MIKYIILAVIIGFAAFILVRSIVMSIRDIKEIDRARKEKSQIDSEKGSDQK